MANFDPVAATAAHLAAMTPAQQAKASDYTHMQHWLLLAGTLVSLLVVFLIIRSGVIQRISDSLQRSRPRPALTSLVTTFVYLVMSSILSLPWAIYRNWWFEKSFDLTRQPLSGWFQDQIKSTIIGWVGLTLLIWALYALMRRAKRTWWIWGGVVVAAFMGVALFLAPIYIEPLFNKYTPAPPGPMRDAVVAMAKANHVPSDKIYIYNGSKQSNRYTANVSGMFGAARIAMSDTMTEKGADVAEVRGVLGHEMGHYVHQHSLLLMSGFGLIAALALGLVNLIFPFMARLLGARGVKGVADPAGVPVLFGSLSVVLLLMTPLQNSLSRYAEADADAFSMTASHEPDGLSKALVKTAEYRAPRPTALEEILFYDHPSVYHRVRAAMDWKAKNLELAEKTAAEDAALEAQVKAQAAPASAPVMGAAAPGAKAASATSAPAKKP